MRRASTTMRRRAASDEKPPQVRVGFAVDGSKVNIDGFRSEGSSPRVRLTEPVVPHLPSLLAAQLQPLEPTGKLSRRPSNAELSREGSDLLSREAYDAVASTPAPAPPAPPSLDWSRRAAALGVSPRGATPRRSRYSNPRHPGAAKLALVSVYGGFSKAEAGDVAAYPPSNVVAARLGPPAIAAPPSNWDGQRGGHAGRGQRRGLLLGHALHEATTLFRTPRRASAADRECYASAEVQRRLTPPAKLHFVPHLLASSTLTFHASPYSHRHQSDRCSGSPQSSAKRRTQIGATSCCRSVPQASL